MIRRKALILLTSALAALAVGVGCTKSESPHESSVVLSFYTGLPETRVGDGHADDGGGIFVDGSGNPDLFIAIANYSGEIVARYCGADTNAAERLDNSSSTRMSIRFKSIQNSGDYTVFAVANTAGGIWGAPENASAWEQIGSATDLNQLTFSELTGDALLSVVNRMPLSAKGSLHVNEGLNGQVELELLRCAAKVGFKFKNETGDPLELKNCTVTLEEINPTQGYLFQQETDAIGTARNLNLISSTITIGNGVTTSLYGDLLVFPSIAPPRAIGNRYYCNISFKIGDELKTFNNLPVHDKQSHDILALRRNQYLQIETRINKGMDISFNFIVHDWNEKTEEILFH